jgi:predicted nuclease of predicted toxin-antitoxin system
MRLLIDNAISPLVANELTQAGYDTLHVRDFGLSSASDAEILALAEREDRILISADTDFGTLLTLRRQTRPSCILLRGDIERHPELQAAALVRELPTLEARLAAGAIVVITRDRIRLRFLSPSSE